MSILRLNFPPALVFGNGSSLQFTDDFSRWGFRNVLLMTTSVLLKTIQPLLDRLHNTAVSVHIYDQINNEPTIADFNEALQFARESHIDSVIGIGGGSVLDLAKLIAALTSSDQNIQEAFGIGNLKHKRKMFLACLPTTSGTGSEVSPNAILLDTSDNLKKGVVSPYLVPDAAYIDPLLTRSVPPEITAATGLDALTHCIEEYINIHAHPIIDLYAREGIHLIAAYLKRAYTNGDDEEARERVALGSLYGGLGLGPVNTAAVHALSYPLGGEFHIPHGLSNAVLLPYVMRYNLESAPERYAEVGLALGAEKGKDAYSTAQNGVQKIFELCREINIPVRLSSLQVPKKAIERMAAGAIKVERLLKNNPRRITLQNAISIYEEAY